MTRASLQSQIHAESRHSAGPAVDKHVARAVALCGDRGVRFTPLRRQVLTLLWEGKRPMGAYELIEALKIRDARPVTPPTVYRTLDFLMAEGMVAKIESRNAYVPCAHPERRHVCLFMLCDQCGTAVEHADPEIEERLAEDAAKLGFQVTRCVVEVQGTCADCLAPDPA